MPDISLRCISEPADTPRLIVIFVHGLGGDPVTTWCHEGGEEDGYFWPRGIGKEIKETAVFTLGYPADKAAWNTGWPIATAATAVLDKLMASPDLRKYPKTPIAFVCHSLGGLIIKKLVLTAFLDRGQTPLKGKGITCLSHEPSRLKAPAPKAIGTIGAPLSFASEIVPICASRLGPRGPSGVIATASPRARARTISRKAFSPPRELEPLMHL